LADHVLELVVHLPGEFAVEPSVGSGTVVARPAAEVAGSCSSVHAPVMDRDHLVDVGVHALDHALDGASARALDPAVTHVPVRGGEKAGW
jgi:hypothetical protein